MDIQQWLENAADREPPDQSEDLHLPGFFSPQHKPNHHIRDYRRKRKPTSSDSSILCPRPLEQPLGAAPSQSPDHVRGTGDAAVRLRSSQISRRSPAMHEDVPTTRYEKRARHQTRPDRYEPKLRVRKREKRAHDEDAKVGPKRRKSHRTGDGGRTAGLVQSFHLKNRPNKSRLTLKPDANVGIFKHGRASAQVACRGAGLRDLAFNEMKFLQKPREHQDELTAGAEQHQSNRKDQKQRHEEEVSAFFVQTQPSKRVQHDVTRHSTEHLTKRRPHHHASPQHNNTKANPPMDFPEKPFLGFGSKGAQPGSKHTAHPSTAYYSWSDSQLEHSQRKQEQPSLVPALQAGQLSAHIGINAQRGRAFQDRELSALKERRNLTCQSATHQGQGGTLIQSRRSKGHARVETYKPRTTEPPRLQKRSVTKTTSLPLPGASSPKARPTLEESWSNRRHGDGNESYHTSDILKIGHSSIQRPRSPSSAHDVDGPTPCLQSNTENQHPRSSTPTGKLLQRAAEAVAHYQTLPARQLPAHASAPENSMTLDGLNFSRVGKDTDMTQSVDNVKAFNPPQRSEVQITNPPDKYDPLSQSHRSQSQRHVPNGLYSSAGSDRATQSRARRPSRSQMAYIGDDEMLDDQPDAEPGTFISDYIYATPRQAEDLGFGEDENHNRDCCDAQVELAVEDIASAEPRTESLQYATPSVRGQPVEQELRSERTGAGGDYGPGFVRDEFAGFWKPHKLY